MTRKDLEEVMQKKFKPIVENAMQRFIGVTIDELGADITAKIGKSPLVLFDINTSILFKEAKKRFAAAYLHKLLEINYGNVSEAARVADVDRRSVHRLVKGSVDVDKIRHDMKRAYDIKQHAVSEMIEEVLDNYKSIVQADKLDKMYKNVSEVSKDIVDELPSRQLTLKEAEEEFEKEYLRKALRENEGNVSATARKIGLRYETLHRKLKKLGLV